MKLRLRPQMPGLGVILAALMVIAFNGQRVGAIQLLDPTTLTKYIDPLPNPLANVLSPVGTLDGATFYQVEMTQFTQQLHSEIPATTVWGYNGTYPGPTFEVQRGELVKVDWINNLRDDLGNPLPHLLPVDTTVHGAESNLPEVRTVVHLHGAHVDAASDGNPEYWYSADPNAAANGMGGPAGNHVVYTYENQQPASTLWYHDHALGITRLNVYAGLAGFYLIRDAAEEALNLPSGAYEVPMVLQDRTFQADGQLFYPRGPGDLIDPTLDTPLAGLPADFPSDASVVSHFLGDTNLVNGKVWPVMDVEPRMYRFRLLNGSNGRFYDLQLDALSEGILPFHQIGTEGGLLEAPTDRSQLLIAPAERADVIVDFSSLSPGDDVFLRNFGPDGPFESPTAQYAPADPNTTGQVMKFHVVPLTAPDTSSLPQTLASVPRILESQAVVTRQLSLNDSVDEFGRPKMLLDGAEWTDPTTELPVLGTTEIWEITNSTVDSHPIHMHLVLFQVLDRMVRPAGGGDPVPVPLEPYELGWKDTVAVNRRETVRVIAKFDDYDGLYVWHCHILEHEDHEMMRRYEVGPGPELIVEQGVTFAINEPHTVPSGCVLTVDGTLTTPQLAVDGLLRGDGLVQSNVINRGTVSPGSDAAGNLTVAGDVSLTSSGVLAVDIFGTGVGQFDSLDVTGQATLSGLLSIKVFDTGQGGNYTLALGDSFEIITASGGLTGGFDTQVVRTAIVGGHLTLRPVVTANSFLLTARPAVDGDINLDGIVNIFDINSVSSNWGTAGPAGDANGDGVVNIFDINLISSNWGDTAAVAVPEPTGAVLVAIMLAIFACCNLRGARRLANTIQVVATASTARMLKLSVVLSAVLALVGVVHKAIGTQITLSPVKDNTLVQTMDGSLSNGAGSYLFAGRTDSSSDYLRRALLAFDIAGNVPAGSVIESATLTLTMSRTKVGAMQLDLHRLTSDWGEGTSNADAQEGGGASATTNDATWIHTFYPGSFWTTPGGDLVGAVSASASVAGNGAYTWGSTAQMVTDVQSWLNTPATNFGWILQGPEGARSAKRFNSRENTNVATRPTLVIEFTSGGPTIFTWIGTGSGGSFHDPANWDTNQAPSSSADIVHLINATQTNQVATLSSNVTIDDLTIDGNTNSMTLSIGQGLTMNVGDLRIGGLGGLAIPLVTGSFGKLNASGPATLSGTLALSTPGPDPSPTASFEFLTYASHAGRFDTITGGEIVPGRSFSLHYNDSRALAIAGQWAATGMELTGELDVPDDLLVSGAWDWNGLLIKRGDGELILDLDGGFSAGGGAALAIVDGTVRLHGTGQLLSLDSLTYGELGQLSGNSSLTGEYGWYGAVLPVPEPSGLLVIAIGLLGFLRVRSIVR
jgi:spore coat protein A, manganese oxidase